MFTNRKLWLVVLFCAFQSCTTTKVPTLITSFDEYLALQKRGYASVYRINQINRKLARINVDLPSEVPLRLVPLLDHCNSRLLKEGINLRMCTYWDVKNEEDRKANDWWLSQAVVELVAKLKEDTGFKGRTEHQIRQEINSGTLFDLLMSLKKTYNTGLDLLYFQNCVVLSASAMAPHFQSGYERDKNKLLRMR
jgi:hypothetical protein